MVYIAVNVTMDAFASVLLLLLVAYLLLPSNRKIRLNRTFALICAANLAMLLGDIPVWLYLGCTAPWQRAAMWWGCLIQYTGGIALPLAYSYYVVTYISSSIRVHRGVMASVLLLAVLGGFFVIANLWNGMYYYIDVHNIYHRGSYWWLSQTIGIVTLTIAAGAVIRYRSALRRRDVVSFLCYNILPLIAVIIQGLFYGLALTYPAVAIAILVIFLNIQSEQTLRLEQKEKELSESRMNIMLSQIQPHFLYNSLAAIRQLCRINPSQAEHAVSEFSLFLRGNMDSLTMKTPIPFSQELSHVQSYLALEQYRFGGGLKIAYDITCTDFRLPALTLQPIVENAVRHGVMARETGVSIIIRTTETANEWQVVIQDDGVGFDPSAIPEKPDRNGRAHIGIENVRWRLAALSGGSLNMLSAPGQGTTAILSIPKGELL